MKRFLSLILAALICCGAAGCVNKMPASYPPQTKTLYVLTDVVNGIGTLQIAAENAVPQHILSLDSARVIVKFCVAANTTIGQYPNGWQAEVKAAYTEAKGNLSPNELSAFGGYLSAFEIILNSF